jgi:hypothetical protein
MVAQVFAHDVRLSERTHDVASHPVVTYLFDFRRINIYFLFCRTNSVRDLIFV